MSEHLQYKCVPSVPTSQTKKALFWAHTDPQYEHTERTAHLGEVYSLFPGSLSAL